MVPEENFREACAAKGLKVARAADLNEALKAAARGPSGVEKAEGGSLWEGAQSTFKEDFSDICGQEAGKRAAQIAMAGFHNILFIGPPDVYKRQMQWSGAS